LGSDAAGGEQHVGAAALVGGARGRELRLLQREARVGGVDGGEEGATGDARALLDRERDESSADLQRELRGRAGLDHAAGAHHLGLADGGRRGDAHRHGRRLGRGRSTGRAGVGRGRSGAAAGGEDDGDGGRAPVRGGRREPRPAS
jgi:hypothetical protein